MSQNIDSLPIDIVLCRPMHNCIRFDAFSARISSYFFTENFGARIYALSNTKLCEIFAVYKIMMFLRFVHRDVTVFSVDETTHISPRVYTYT